jgi:hypothetical protein
LSSSKKVISFAAAASSSSGPSSGSGNSIRMGEMRPLQRVRLIADDCR